MTESEALKVPVETLEASLILAGGDTLRGRLFLPPGASAPSGPMRPEERLNDADDFFPFQPDGHADVFLINKGAVSSVTLSVPERDVEQALPHRRVVVTCDGREYEGSIVLDTPDTQLRVLDRLNAPGRFVAVRQGRLEHLVNKRRIARVVEVKS
jgi:hypothetical protein